MERIQRAVNHAVALLLAALLCGQTCLAQVDPWERVKLIEPGKNVHVRLHSGTTVKGRMESWNPDGLSVRQGKDKVVPLAKSDIARVAMATGLSRGRKAGYAALIGGGAGAAIFGAAAASGPTGLDVPAGALVAAGAIWIGGISAGVAALFPQHKEVIYTAAPLGRHGSNP